MNTITLDAPAKINLSLDVVKRKENGYHELSMIMQEIDLRDMLTITSFESLESGESQRSIKITCNNSHVPLDNKNIVWRAVELLKDKYNINSNVEIHIEKRIPLSGGLAGGSTDAAATLKGLNELWKLNLTEEKLMELGVQLGADVPFFIKGGTALAEGIGEKLTSLHSFKDRLILIANPGFDVSTRDVYENLDLDNLLDRPNMDCIVEDIEKGDTFSLSKNMKNVLESVTIKMHPEIDSIKKDMIDCGALGSLMSGSGASVFGIFETIEELENCREILKEKIDTVVSTVTI